MFGCKPGPTATKSQHDIFGEYSWQDSSFVEPVMVTVLETFANKVIKYFCNFAALFEAYGKVWCPMPKKTLNYFILKR